MWSFKKKMVDFSDIHTEYHECPNFISADDIPFIETADVPDRSVFRHGRYAIRPKEFKIKLQKVEPQDVSLYTKVL